MAHPTADFTQTKKLIAWAERAAKNGLDLNVDLQPSIDDPAEMERIVRSIKGRAPLQPNFPQILCFEEPQSHKEAHRILGDEFFGLDVAQQRIRPFTQAEIDERLPLRLFDEVTRQFLSEEQTLAIVEECKLTHALLATHNLSLPELHSLDPNGFANDSRNLWFSEESQRDKWSDQQRITVPWLLVRKDVVPKSWEKTINVQKLHLQETQPKERSSLPVEHCYAARLRFLVTGRKLCEGYVVRFGVQVAEGHWVDARWRGDQVDVFYWFDDAGDNIASASVRHFLLSYLTIPSGGGRVVFLRRFDPAAEHPADLVDDLLDTHVRLHVDDFCIFRQSKEYPKKIQLRARAFQQEGLAGLGQLACEEESFQDLQQGVLGALPEGSGPLSE